MEEAERASPKTPRGEELRRIALSLRGSAKLARMDWRKIDTLFPDKEIGAQRVLALAKFGEHTADILERAALLDGDV